MVHCEGYDAIKFMTERLEPAGKTAPYYHAVSRPQIVEREAAHRAISHAELIDVPIMIVHVSGREAMEQIRWAQQRGLKVYGETCTQYIALTADDLKGLGMDETRRQIRLLAAAARPRELGRDLGGHHDRRVPDLLVRPLPVLYDGPQGKLNRPRAARRSAGCRTASPASRSRMPMLFSEGVVEGPHHAGAVRGADLHQPRQDLWPLPAEGLDRRRLGRRHRAVGSRTGKVTITQSLMHHGADYTP